MIRPAEEQDIPALIDLAIEALSIDPYETLVISHTRVRACVEECVYRHSHFAWVSEAEGIIQGALGAMVAPLMMYERQQAQIVMWYCKQPGDGIKLMREFLRWVKGRPLVRQVIYGMERRGDVRIRHLVLRAGFQEALPTFILTR